MGRIFARLLPCALLVGLFASAQIAAQLGPQQHVGPLQAPAPVPDGRIAQQPRWEELDCARCHRAIAEEWSRSVHALSWLDELYQEDVADKKKPEGCWGCHAPEPVHGGDLQKKPTARAGERDLGIQCETCHRGPDGSILGPFGAPTSAHPSQKHESFTSRSDALCASCHRTNIGPVIGIAKDFEAANLRERGLSCVGCHMQAVERRIAEGPAGSSEPATPIRAGRSHSLQTPRDPRFLAMAFEFQMHDGRRVQVHNRAGHRVPGLVGREIEFEFRALDAQGRELASQRLLIDFRTPLTLEAPLEVDLGVEAATVAIRGLHRDPRLEAPVTFLERTLERAR